MKLCKDCKFFGGDLKNEDGTRMYYTSGIMPCLRLQYPVVTEINLVTGIERNLEEKWRRCEYERYSSRPFPPEDVDICGKDGKYFVPNE